MLRTHVEHHLFGIEECLLPFCRLLLLHIKLGDGGQGSGLGTGRRPLTPSRYLRSAYFTSIRLVSKSISRYSRCLSVHSLSRYSIGYSLRSGWPGQSDGSRMRRRSGWPSNFMPNMSKTSRSIQFAPSQICVTLGQASPSASEALTRSLRFFGPE